MNIIDIEKEPSIKDIQTDVCIIGSGPAGGIVAAELAKKHINVLLLEAGSTLPDYNRNSISTFNLSSDIADLRFGWSHQFGGSSNLWAGRISPLEKIDFVKRSWIPDSGWPFAISTLMPYYKKATELLQVPKVNYFFEDDKLDNTKNSLTSLLSRETGLEAKCFQWSKTPFIVSNYLEKIIKHYPSLKILLNAPVSRLQENIDGSHVMYAQITKKDTNIVKVKARLFIVAAGGIETPRLLLNSNQTKSTGIGNEYDVVGRYFSTHPKANIAAIILKKSISTSHALFMDKPLGAGNFRYGIGFSQDIQKHLSLLNHYVQLSPLLEYQANRAFEAIKKTKVLENNLINNSKLIQGFLPGLGKITYAAIGRIVKLQPRTSKFILRGFLDQFPNKENRIKLSTDTKKDGTHKVDIQWHYSEKDKQSVLNIFFIS